MVTRECGGCTLCCKLLPVHSRPGEVPFHKLAGERCEHARHGKGCIAYHKRPNACRFFNCRWLLGDDTADLPRPDRARYVIDPTADYVTVENKGTGERRNIEAVQIWVDPMAPNAWQDQRCLDYI